jgi:hypothetical protein
MRREINASDGDRLDLRDAARRVTDASDLALLEATFNERIAQTGGRAVVVDGVVEIAAGRGYKGSVEEAARLLIAAGYRVDTGPSGWPVAWRDP